MRVSRRHGVKGEICEALKISRDTLRSYAFYNCEDGEKFGPTSLDILIRIADYFGDDISTVMLAAERSTDHRVFDAMLLCDVHAHHRPEVAQALAPARALGPPIERPLLMHDFRHSA